MMESKKSITLFGFLEEIKENLPNSIKQNKKLVNEILEDMENHIFDKVEDLKEQGYNDRDTITIAIKDMGDAKKIAAQYYDEEESQFEKETTEKLIKNSKDNTEKPENIEKSSGWFKSKSKFDKFIIVYAIVFLFSWIFIDFLNFYPTIVISIIFIPILTIRLVISLVKKDSKDVNNFQNETVNNSEHYHWFSSKSKFDKFIIIYAIGSYIITFFALLDEFYEVSLLLIIFIPVIIVRIIIHFSTYKKRNSTFSDDIKRIYEFPDRYSTYGLLSIIYGFYLTLGVNDYRYGDYIAMLGFFFLINGIVFLLRLESIKKKRNKKAALLIIPQWIIELIILIMLWAETGGWRYNNALSHISFYFCDYEEFFIFMIISFIIVIIFQIILFIKNIRIKDENN